MIQDDKIGLPIMVMKVLFNIVPLLQKKLLGELIERAKETVKERQCKRKGRIRLKDNIRDRAMSVGGGEVGGGAKVHPRVFEIIFSIP